MHFRGFLFGGCGGNRNKFDTIEECQTTCIQVYTSLHSTLLVYTVGIYQSTFIYCRYTITIYQSTCIQVYCMLDSFCLDIFMYCILYPSVYPGSQVYVRLLLSRYTGTEYTSSCIQVYTLVYMYPGIC